MEATITASRGNFSTEAIEASVNAHGSSWRRMNTGSFFHSQGLPKCTYSLSVRSHPQFHELPLYIVVTEFRRAGSYEIEFLPWESRKSMDTHSRVHGVSMCTFPAYFRKITMMTPRGLIKYPPSLGNSLFAGYAVHLLFPPIR